MTQREILDYEIRTTWWVAYISPKWLQNLAGSYFSWKVKRKYNAYVRSKQEEHRLKVRLFIKLHIP